MAILLRLITDILKILPPLFIISFVSIFFLKILKITDFIEKLILIFIFNWAQLIISIEFLSIFKFLNIYTLYSFYLIELIICIIFIKVKKIPIKISLINVKQTIKNFYVKLKLNKALKIFLIIWLIIIIIIPLYIGIAIHPPNYDSMTYHLARAGFWYQNNSINHYFTRYVHQNDYPVNSELGFLWLFIFTSSDLLTFSIQWLSFIVALFALYRLLRELGYNRNISFITTFIFSTFDMCILQASSTQNDMIVAAFVILIFYFLIKYFNSTNGEIKYLIFASITAGIVIGIKGYTYLFIPGFLIFILIYGKINKKNISKFLYVLLFSLLGIIIFASYSLLQNYISYNNPLGFTGTISEMKMEIFNFKAFFSNLLRHLFSFYQENEGFGFLSKQINKYFHIIHNKLQINVSDPLTTWPGLYFKIWEHRVNFDTGYFGMLFSLFVLPVSIYNFILFIILKIKKVNHSLNKKYTNSLTATIIPAIFFIGYVLLFKWHIWAGRYMIAFVLLIMISVAEFFELVGKFKKKFFTSLIILIILLSIWSSIYPLFNNEYASISKSIKKYFFTQKKEEQTIKESPIDLMKKVNNLLYEYFPEKSDIGIVLDPSDWVYIYFGDKFQRKLTYITDEDWNNNSIKNILEKNDFDALLVNKNCKDFNNNLQPLIEKITETLVLKVDNSNFEDLFIPKHECKFIKTDNEILIKVEGDDPYFENNFLLNFGDHNSYIIKIDMFTKIESKLQIYYSINNKEYNEKDSIVAKILPGNNNVIFELPAKNLTKLRIDPINIKEDIILKTIEFFIKTKIHYEIIGDYYLFFNK